MRHSLCIFLLVLSSDLQSQANAGTVMFAGHYSAKVDESNLTLIIEPKLGTNYSGVLNDGYTSLTLELELTGTSFAGIGKESSTGVEMNVNGGIEGDHLHFTLVLDPYGEEEDFKVVFIRDGNQQVKEVGGSNQSSAANFPSDATHPQEMLGTWTKEELYQSGYGDSYMGAGSSQSMTFLSGGRMAEAGSSSYISGSNYSGQSEGEGGGIIPGVTWYTIGNQLYMQGMENGQMQQIHLGKYYVENNNMLITGTNGEKVLLTRK